MPNEVAPQVIFPVKDPAWLYVPRASIVIPVGPALETYYLLQEDEADITLEDASGFLVLEAYDG